MGLVGCGLGGMEEIKKSASPKKKPLRGKKVGFAEKKLRLWGLACAPAGGGIEGRAQNIAPLHLMRCLIAGYNLAGALEGRAQNITPLQDYKTILPIKP